MSAEVLAEVHDGLELHAAFRARAEQLNVTRSTIDEVAGLTPGHASKLLAPHPIRTTGANILGPMLGVLGLKLLVVEDPEAFARVRGRLVPRDASRVRYEQRIRLKKSNRKVHRMSTGSIPKYRATESNTTVGGKTYQKGEEFELANWPNCFCGAVEPVNDVARLILRRWQSHGHGGELTTSTWNHDHGRYFVPHYLPSDLRRGRPPLPDQELPGMPRYRAVWPSNYAGRQVREGDEIAYCGWPTDDLAPINEEARRVVEYYNRYQHHGKLLPAPWCDFTGELFLPEFFTPQQQIAARAKINRPWGNGSDMIDRIKTPPLPNPGVARHGGSRRRVSA